MAKQGKKLTYKMKVFLEKRGVEDIDNYSYTKNTNEKFVIINRINGKEIEYLKVNYNVSF